MNDATEPSLIEQMASSRPTRVAVGVLLLAVVACVVVGAWFAGHANATEQRFAVIETAIAEGRGERREIGMDSREVYTRLTVIETRLVGLDETIERMRVDVSAIREAVAPLPRVASKGGE